MKRSQREKIISPEYLPGQIIWSCKFFWDSACLLIRQPSRASLEYMQLAARVIPKYTMLSLPRLMNLVNLIKTINKKNIEGDVVECGTWNGGAAAVMAAYQEKTLNTTLPPRHFWLFDSFQGLPKPTANDGALLTDNHIQGLFKGNPEYIKRLFLQLRIPSEHLHIIPGWFQQTIPEVRNRKIALLHIDADLYDSIFNVLEQLYDTIVPRGFCVCDDYSWSGGKKAIDTFLEKRGLGNQEKFFIDGAIYFQKPE